MYLFAISLSPFIIPCATLNRSHWCCWKGVGWFILLISTVRECAPWVCKLSPKSTPLPASLTSHDEEENTSHFLPETKKSMLCDVKIFPDILNIVIADQYFFSQTKCKILVFGFFFLKAVLWAKNSVLEEVYSKKTKFLICLIAQMLLVNVGFCILWTSWAAGNNLLELIWGLRGILRNSCDPKAHFLISAQHVHGVCYHKEVKLSQ